MGRWDNDGRVAPVDGRQSADQSVPGSGEIAQNGHPPAGANLADHNPYAPDFDTTQVKGIEDPTEPLRVRESDDASASDDLSKRPTPVRVGVTAIDQAVSSISNFAVGVAIARVAGVAGLGAFSLVYAIWLVVAAMHRSLITDPMAIEGDLRKPDAAKHMRAGLASELTLGLLTSAGFVIAGLLMLIVGQGTFAVPFLAVAPWLPFLLAQDYWRWVGFMSAQPSKALSNDIVFDIVQGIGFVTLIVVGARSSFAAITIWGIGAAAGALYGLYQFSVRPTMRGGFQHLRMRWGISKWLAGSNAAGWGVSQATVVIAGVFLGPVGLGGLKAAVSLVSGPALVLIQAGGSIGLPEASRALAANGWKGLRRVERTVTVAGMLTVGAIGLVIFFFGSKLLVLFYGPGFGKYAPEALLISIGWFIMAMGLGAILCLKATRHTNMLFHVSIVALIASVVASIFLISAFGLVGAAMAMVVTCMVTSAGQLLAHHLYSRKAAESLTRSELPRDFVVPGVPVELGEFGTDITLEEPADDGTDRGLNTRDAKRFLPNSRPM